MLRFILCGLLISDVTASSVGEPPQPTTRATVHDVARGYRIEVYNRYRTQRTVYDQLIHQGEAALKLSETIAPSAAEQAQLVEWFKQAKEAGGQLTPESLPPLPAVANVSSLETVPTAHEPALPSAKTHSTSTSSHPEPATGVPSSASSHHSDVQATAPAAATLSSPTKATTGVISPAPTTTEKPSADHSTPSQPEPNSKPTEPSGDASGKSSPATAELNGPSKFLGAIGSMMRGGSTKSDDAQSTTPSTTTEPVEPATISDSDLTQLKQAADEANKTLADLQSHAAEQAKTAQKDLEAIEKDLATDGPLTTPDAEMLVVRLTLVYAANEINGMANESAPVPNASTGAQPRELFGKLRERIAGKAFQGTPAERKDLLNKIDGILKSGTANASQI